jgi:hypothetical protein
MDRRYPSLLTAKEILQLLKDRVYAVDPATGKVTRPGPNGREVTPFLDGYGRKFVRLYARQKRPAIAVARLLWMSVTLQTIPRNFEIHHKDEVCGMDSWSNLVCLHRLDHLKEHQTTEEIPF